MSDVVGGGAVKAAVVMGVIALCAACSSSGPKPLSASSVGSTGSTTLAPVAAGTTTTGDPTPARVVGAYRQGEAAFVAVTRSFPIHPDDPRLAQYMTGIELNTVHVSLTKAALAGQYAVGGIDLAPVFTSLNGTTAIVTDCYFDHSRIVDGKTGQTVVPADTQRTLEKVTMALVDGTWKIAQFEKMGSGCVPSAS